MVGLNSNPSALYNKMQAKLLQHQTLIFKRKLLVDIHTFTFAPAVPKIEIYEDSDHPIWI